MYLDLEGPLHFKFEFYHARHTGKIIIANIKNMSDRGNDEDGEGEDLSSKQQGDAASCGSDGVFPSLEQPTVRCFHGFEKF